MMNPSIITLLGIELVVLALGFSLTWIVISWRRRLQRDRAVAEMIDLLEKNAAERNVHYRQWLQGHQILDEAEAEKVAQEWIGVEKQFWQASLTWHLQPEQNSLADFPHHLQRLLNSRLDILGRALGPAEVPEELPGEEKTPVSELEEPSEIPPESEDSPVEMEEAKEETPVLEETQTNNDPIDEEDIVLQENEDSSDDSQALNEPAAVDESINDSDHEEEEIVVYSDRNPTVSPPPGDGPTSVTAGDDSVSEEVPETAPPITAKQDAS